MKLMLCQRCGDVRSPDPVRRVVTACRCGTFFVWWEDPQAGIIKLYTANAANRKYGFIIGLHNWFLMDPDPITSAQTIKWILEATPDTYVFKRIESVVARFKPGYTNDSSWAIAEEFTEIANLMQRITAESTRPIVVLELGPQIEKTEATP